MNRFVKMGLLMVLVIALFGSYSFVKAQNETSQRTTSAVPPVFNSEDSNVPPPVVKHVLVGTYSNVNRPASFSALAGGTTAVDPVTTITCPGTSGTCTIEYDQNMQFGFGTSGDSFSFCIALDGSIVSPGCPTSGAFPTGVAAVSFSQEVTGVSHGTHTVQSLVQSGFGGSIGFYTETYRVYKP
jgi:hypothetical protein